MVIAKNQQQFKKNVFSANEEGEKLKVYRSLSDADEANFVAANIWELHNSQQRMFNEFAILYRTNSQTRAFEDALRRKIFHTVSMADCPFIKGKRLKIY